MSKEFKRCPRCNTKTPINLVRCGNCGLNYDKFNSATNAEAKSAFRMGEKGRVLYAKTIPSDINKPAMFFKALLGGWFGLHYFCIGRIWRGLLQVLGLAFAFVYTYGSMYHSVQTGYIGYLLLICGIIWAYTFITWFSDSFAILFNKFKYPVSLPYKNNEHKQNITKTAKEQINKTTNDIKDDTFKTSSADIKTSDESQDVKTSEQVKTQEDTISTNENKGE